MGNSFYIQCLNCVFDEENCAQQVLKINKENLIENGGSLKFDGILPHDYVVVAKSGDKIIGYTLLAENFFLKNDIYIMQVAVDNNYKHKGIGSAMYDFIFKHAKGYKYVAANVGEQNKISYKFHKKLGFEDFGIFNGYRYNFEKPVDAKEDFKHSSKEIYHFKTKEKQLSL